MTEECAECGRPISDEPTPDEWPISRWYDDLCIPCGVDEMDPR